MTEMFWVRSEATRFSTSLCCSAALLVASLCACSKPEVGTVQGRVTLDGQPLTKASIVFEDTSRGISVNVALAADGTFNARTYDNPGLPPGMYQVAVRPGGAGDGSAPLVGDADPGAATATSPIPKQYQSIKTSGLTAEVEVGENPPYEFALTN